MPAGLVLVGVLVLANLAIWATAFTVFRSLPALLLTASLAWGFGLRHALDADHLAAIDNVTRRLVAEGRRPIATGLFFSLGHSSVVVVVSFLAAAGAFALRGHAALQDAGALFGTLASAIILFAVAAMNLAILRPVLRSFRAARRGFPVDDPADTPMIGGPLARLLRPLLGLARRSWHLFPIGVLFGLGFDTATEVGLLGLSAASTSHGVGLGAVMLFPALFTAGMSLVDSADGILMGCAYAWATAAPVRKLGYDLAITLLSVVLAVVVGGLELAGLLADRLDLHDVSRDIVDRLSGHAGLLGLGIVAATLGVWGAAVLRARLRAGRRGLPVPS